MSSTSSTESNHTQSDDTPPSESEYQQDRDDCNPRWAWSDALVDFVNKYVESPSLKVCTGTTPMCDENVDINDYEGVTRVANMFNLPTEWTDKFAGVVSDPPWRGKTSEERKQMFEEVFRVAAPGALIIYNATWIPERERALLRTTRFRQGKDFWDNPSFLTVFQKKPTGSELVSMFDAEEEEHLVDTVMTQRGYKRVDPEYLTDPRIIDPANETYCCPKCGDSHLEQNRDERLANPPYQWNLYHCMNTDCGFRPLATEIYEQADTTCATLQSLTKFA